MSTLFTLPTVLRNITHPTTRGSRAEASTHQTITRKGVVRERQMALFCFDNMRTVSRTLSRHPPFLCFVDFRFFYDYLQCGFGAMHLSLALYLTTFSCCFTRGFQATQFSGRYWGQFFCSCFRGDCTNSSPLYFGIRKVWPTKCGFRSFLFIFPRSVPRNWNRQRFNRLVPTIFFLPLHHLAPQFRSLTLFVWQRSAKN